MATAGDAVVGALRVTLGADTAQFEDGMKRAEGVFGRFSSSIGKGAAGIAAAVAGIGIAVGLSLKNAFDELENVGNLSAKLGKPVEELSKVKYVADQLGISFDGLAGKLSAAMGDDTSDGGRFLKAMGIAAKDAADELRPMEAVLNEVVNKLATYKDGADKAKIATELLGDEAAMALPKINRLADDGIRRLVEQAEKLGYVMSAETVEGASRFNEIITSLKTSTGAFGLALAARFHPVLTAIAEEFKRIVVEGNSVTAQSGAMKFAIEGLVVAFKVLVSAAVGVGVTIMNVWEVLKTGIGVISAFKSLDLAGAWEAIKSGATNIAGNIEAATQALNKLWLETGKAPDVSKAFQTAAAPTIKTLDEIKIAARAALNELINSPAYIFEEKMAAVKAALDAGTINLVQFGEIVRRLREEQFQMLRRDAREALDEIVNAPTETFANKMAAVENAVRSGTITFREFGKVTKQINQENVQHWQNLATSAANALTTIFGKSKAAAIAAAIINTGVGITKAMELPWPFNLAQAALVAATGAAQIANIRSTNLSGGGGTAPAPPSESSAGPQSPGAGQTINVTGLTSAQLLNGDLMAAFIQELLDRQRDGARIILERD